MTTIKFPARKFTREMFLEAYIKLGHGDNGLAYDLYANELGDKEYVSELKMSDKLFKFWMQIVLQVLTASKVAEK